MSFPANGIIDNFDRADETPLAGNWSTPVDVGDISNNLVSNQVKQTTNGFASNWWNPATFGPDAEAYMDYPTAGNGAKRFALWIKTAFENTSSLNGYSLTINSSGSWNLWKTVAGTITNLATSGHGFAAGRKAGINYIGGTVSTYEYSGSWNQTPVMQVTDNAIPDPGHVGFAQSKSGASASSIFDNFGGGTVSDPLDTRSMVGAFALG